MKKMLTLLLLLVAAVNAQEKGTIKLVKDLTPEENCAYLVLQKLLGEVTDGPAMFYAKVTITKAEGTLSIATYAKALLKYKDANPMRSDTVVRCVVYLKDRNYSNMALSASGNATGSYGGSGTGTPRGATKKVPSKPASLPAGKLKIQQFTEDMPRFKIGKEAQCLEYRWEIINKSFQYNNTFVADAAFFVTNEQQYNKVDYVHTDYAVVSKDGVYGVVSNKGKMLLPVKYKYIYQTKMGLLFQDEDSLYYFINPLTGKKLTPGYAKVEGVGLYNLAQDLFAVGNATHFGMINSSFKEVVPMQYEYFHTVGLANSKTRLLVGTRNKKRVVLNPLTGKEITPWYDNIENTYVSRQPYYKTQGGSLYGLISADKVLLEPVYEDVVMSIATEKTATYAAKKGGKYALFNAAENKWATGFEYDTMFSLGYIIGVGKNGKTGALNADGAMVIGIVYDRAKVELENRELVVIATRNGGETKFDQNGTCISNCK